MSLSLGVTCLILLAGPLASASTAQELRSPGTVFRHVPADRAAMRADTATDRVFGGREVADGQYPFQVALLNTEGLSSDPESQYNSQFCGGTLVAPNWVLTAAHCMMDSGHQIAPGDVTILTGSVDLAAGRRIEAKAIFVHELYDEASMDHDVALIELATSLDIDPIVLDVDVESSGSAIVTGWGMTEDGQYPRHLLSSDIELVSNAICGAGIKAIYASDLKRAITDLAARYRIGTGEAARLGDALAAGIGEPLTGTMVCAGVKSGARDTCYGDSGGPLFAMRGGNPVQLGIVSWGEGPEDANIKCGHADAYGVYSRVASFQGWIEYHVGKK